MQRLSGLDGLRAVPPGAVLSIGNYDGVHTGHAAILRAMREAADDCRAPVVVATFEPHPLTVLRPDLAPARLTTLAEKERLLAAAGVDVLVTLPPTPAVLGLTAWEFWGVLKDDVRPARIIEGQQFNFGSGRSGTIERLIEWAAGSGIVVDRRPAHAIVVGDTDVVVSSSLIRALLAEGRVEDAARCLGRTYALDGVVVRGFQRGRTIGVPTANLDAAVQLVPGEGVYAGRVVLHDRPWPAAVSIGATPTFEQRRWQVEVHVIGFSGDLYGTSLSVGLSHRLRDQTRFASVEELKAQLARDILAAHELSLDASAAGW